MSKAFTREDDTSQEADLPERAVSQHLNLVTSDGLDQIEAAIARLTEEQARARAAGDATAAPALRAIFAIGASGGPQLNSPSQSRVRRCSSDHM